MTIFRETDSSGLADVPGLMMAGVHCDIRGKADGRLDLALVFSSTPCRMAGVFTRNAFAAAPVRLGRMVLESGRPVQAILANSGNANACTGEQGEMDAHRMARLAADALRCPVESVLVCSTGRIGEALPMEVIEKGIGTAVESLSMSKAAALQAADAILTSDTRRKIATYRVETAAGIVSIAGMAKGAGMIEPDMATMLAFIATDADVDRSFLQELLISANNTSFNRITVDGDASTNDSVLLLANGFSGIGIRPGTQEARDFGGALTSLCRDLALMIVGDGERTTKVVEVHVAGALNDEEARLAGRAVANSLLVKTSWYGGDPNWGRVMDALGYSGASMDENSVSISYAPWAEGDPVPAFLRGTVVGTNRSEWKTIVGRERFRVLIDLGRGNGIYRLWSTDLTEGYVQFNKSE